MAVLPDFSADKFQAGAPIDNELHPLVPGTIHSYGGIVVDEEGEKTVERNDVFTTFATHDVDGIATTVVRDTEYEDGVVTEDTVDFFAQDEDGNVWYFGEQTFAFEYDDEGNWVGTSTEGSWQAGEDGEDGASPGHIMPADPGFGAGYYQEFAPGVAEDEAIVVGVGEKIPRFRDVLKTLDTSALEPDQAEFKYYAPGIGLVREEGLDEDGNVTQTHSLQKTVTVGPADEAAAQGRGARLAAKAAADVPEVSKDDLTGLGPEVTVTFVESNARRDSAVGAYTFDTETGEIGEGRILFAGTEDAEEGSAAVVEVGAGEGLGLFLIPDPENTGLDLAEFAEGGLFFTNILSGEGASLDDPLAPLVTNGEDVLPITALHAFDFDAADGFNFLNRTGGVHATSEAGDEGLLIGFEDTLSTERRPDNDFDDVLIAVGAAAPPASPIPESDVLLL